MEFSNEMIQHSEQQKDGTDYVLLLESEKEKNVKLKEVFKTTQEKYEVQVKELDSSLKEVKVEYDAKTKQFDDLLTYSEKAMEELTVAVKAENAKTGQSAAGEPQDET